MKFNCVIDTSSSIYLYRVHYNRKPLLTYLKSVVNLVISSEVSKEMTDHFIEGMPTIQERQKYITTVRRHSMPEYERRLFGRTYAAREKNKGEIDNFVVAIDQMHHFRKIGFIFLTDDANCLRGILKDCMESFPTVRIWTSYEVVLFFYIEGIIPSIDLANDAIADLISSTAPALAARSQEFTQKLIKLRADYNSRLKTISKIL